MVALLMLIFLLGDFFLLWGFFRQMQQIKMVVTFDKPFILHVATYHVNVLLCGKKAG